MYTLVRKTKADDENRKVSTYGPKSSGHFLEGLIFQLGGGAEFRAPEQWIVSEMQVLQHCWLWSELDGLPRPRENEGYRESVDLQKWWKP